jgi:hypothetical protein
MTKCGTMNAELLHGPERQHIASGATPGEGERGIPVVAVHRKTGGRAGTLVRINRGGMMWK